MNFHEMDSRELREKVLKAIELIYFPVSSTMGPAGKTVLLKSGDGSPVQTKDGVTVAKFVESDDPIINAIVQILKQAAISTNINAGDGTTTSIVLAANIFFSSLKYLDLGDNPNELKVGMEKAVEKVVEELKKSSLKVDSTEQIKSIATISANGDEVIGNLIEDVVSNIGKDGSIVVEMSKSFDTVVEYIDGFRFNSGYVSSALVNDHRTNSVRYNDALVLVTDQRVSFVEQIMGILTMAAKEGKPLVIIAEEVEGQALSAVILNAINNTMKIAVVSPPAFGEERKEILKDLALVTGAEFISPYDSAMLTLEKTRMVHLGRVKSVEIYKNVSTFVGGGGEQAKILAKTEELKEELRREESEIKQKILEGRISRLSSGAAVIRVGGYTEAEAIEKTHRVQDSLEAVKSSLEHGYLPGGGIPLLLQSESLKMCDFKTEEQKHGAQIIKNALSSPFRKLCGNSGVSFDSLSSEVLKRNKRNKNKSLWKGYNFLTRGFVPDMIGAGILDPTKVEVFALLNALSAASMLITLSCVLVKK